MRVVFLEYFIKAAPFVNVMGVLGAGRLFNLRRQLRIDAWPARGSCCPWAGNEPRDLSDHFPALYRSTFPPLARQYHLEHPSGGMHRAARPE